MFLLFNVACLVDKQKKHINFLAFGLTRPGYEATIYIDANPFLVQFLKPNQRLPLPLVSSLLGLLPENPDFTSAVNYLRGEGAQSIPPDIKKIMEDSNLCLKPNQRLPLPLVSSLLGLLLQIENQL
jgi:hypothetical protein